MIASQRKAHKFIWLALAIIVPVLLFLAFNSVDFTSVQKEEQKDQLVAKLEGNLIKVQLNKPLASPSAVVYALTSEDKSGTVLGQLNGIGSYTFTAIQNTSGILVVDKIKGEELFKVEF